MAEHLHQPDLIQQRVAARHNLIDFVSYTFPQYIPEPFHYTVADELDRVVRGETQRLMIFAPPQHGKSQLVSVHLPAYFLGRQPDQPVILASYGARLAESKSRQARALVESESFAQIFRTVRTAWNSRNVQQWTITGRRGGMLAVGVGGPITGHGAMLAIIDDPFSSWEMAHRQLQRERVWEWYQGTFRTRVWEGGAIILIMTRWHQDDLAGRLLNQQADHWRVLRFPALAEGQAERNQNDDYLGLPTDQPDLLGRGAGQPLCPQRFSYGALQEIRRDVGGSVWAAEYQGVPRPTEGSRFKRFWFIIAEVLPVNIVSLVRYWDRAGSEDSGDYTVGLLMARTDEGLYYVVDVVRLQASPLKVQQVIQQTAQLDQQRFGGLVQIWVEQEGGSAGKESAEAITRLLAGYDVHTERPSGSKEVRANPFAAQCEAGNVRLLKGVWNSDYIEEMIAFPAGRNDDQVDGSSGAFNKLALVSKPISGSRVVSAQGVFG